ncbi:uncharacterized protein B0H18DRAFT_1121823 [Fomitopsis serialis]|uniref:uncharacterized protein n=1 Tax=Fomitopsis serialis TaxID=139415 RepID=UPI002007CDED|nr:uncharacterized protein B0H18DRAFT_1121823 [Neoantrodia serialis]KAH9920586.1 hypothetical protein B0H18DRAFT_1121823 [Neoantrodia serialis]
MALELGPKGVRTNVVAPGYIDTPTNSGVVKGGEDVMRMEDGNSLGRLGTPEEIADVVAFLMSEEARIKTDKMFYAQLVGLEPHVESTQQLAESERGGRSAWQQQLWGGIYLMEVGAAACE